MNVEFEEKVFAALRELEAEQGERQTAVSSVRITNRLLPFRVSHGEVVFTLGVLAGKKRVQVYDCKNDYLTFRSLPESEAV